MSGIGAGAATNAEGEATMAELSAAEIPMPAEPRRRRRRRLVRELHWSQLKHMGRSPAHFRHAVLNPFEPTPAMRLGTLVHAQILGGRYHVWDGDRRGAAWNEFETSHLGLIVTTKEVERARRMSEAVKASPLAVPLLVGDKERGWEATMFGRLCAGRIDVAGRGFIVDVKTTNTTEPSRFQRACLAAGYHAQLAWYAAARQRLGERVDECFIVGVESTAPHPVVVLRLTPRALEEGEKLNRLWVERLDACELADEWPGYAQSVLELDVPDDASDALVIDGEEVDL